MRIAKRMHPPAAGSAVLLALCVGAALPALLRAQRMPPALPAPVSPTVPAPPSGFQRLTIAAAEQLALRNNPRIAVARLLALAQAQATREVRSVEMPSVAGNLTAVDAHNGGRITAGLLNNPVLYTRAAGGLTLSQLITDFGRTHHLVMSAKANAQALDDSERATRQAIVLAVDQAYYEALSSQAVLKVAEQTVRQRQDTVDQVGALTASKLRSDLDLSFANVELSQAKLLLLDARNRTEDTMANLNALLGSERYQQFMLVDETGTAPEAAPKEAEALVETALKARPDLAALNDTSAAAQQFSTSEHDLWRPTVSVLAAGGGAPVRADQIASSWYGAVGANLNIPVFNGFLYNARAREAEMRAGAAKEQVRNLRDAIARDVRTAVHEAQAAFERIAVTRQLLDESNLGLDLAQTRYQLGLSGIVELSQAQLAQTQGQIAYANARYTYESALAVLRFQTGQ